MKDIIVKISYMFDDDGVDRPATIQTRLEAESEISALTKVLDAVLNKQSDWVYSEQLKRGHDIVINVFAHES